MTVVASGAGELLTDEEQRRVQVKADRDELAVTESRYAEIAVLRMVVHTFRNEGPGDARFLNLHAPSKGFIQHVREGGDPDRFDTFEPSER
jgi:hypothetical protein